MARKDSLFLAIGVRKPETMQVLPGVLPSIDAIADWAFRAGYNTVKIDDRDKNKEVTVERIRDLLTPKDPDTGKRDPSLLLDRPRIVVYFCGHGLFAPGDHYWILSAGPDQPNERISSVGFRDALASYGPKQISIISDACRTPKALQGGGQSIVDFFRGLSTNPQKDNFFSSQDGTASFSMPPNNGDPGYCVFSRVLLRALSAPPELEALDRDYRPSKNSKESIVSSFSLANYLEKKVPDAALDIGKLQVPQCDTGFRPPEHAYAKFSKVPGIPPEGSAVPGPDSEALQSQRIDRSKSEWRKPYSYAAAQTADWLKKTTLSRSEKAPFILSGGGIDAEFSVFGTGGELRGVPIKVPRRIPLVGPRRRHQLFRQFTGFAQSQRSSVLLCQAGTFVSVLPMFQGLWCNAIIEPSPGGSGSSGGVELVTWGSWKRPLALPLPKTLQLSASEALKGFSSGALRSGDIPVITADMRKLKHVDPLYGIVAAYLYHRIGDIDNVRRMCTFYLEHEQDVPFDIAMLAQLKFQKRENGGFVVDVPKVSETPRQQRPPNAPDYVWCKTNEVRVNVAGVTPLLRAGWQNLGASSQSIHRRCLDLMDSLTDSPIATFRGERAFTMLHSILLEVRS